MTQQEFKTTTAGASQCDKILEHLEANRGEWVPMPQLYHVSGAFAAHSRVSQLRGEGHVIEHKNERVGKTIHSFYRLVL